MKITNHNETINFFNHPSNARQRQYEAIRAVIVDGMNVKESAEKFNYLESSLKVLLRRFRNGKLDFFPEIRKKKSKKIILSGLQGKIVQLRNKYLSAKDICEELNKEGYNLSVRTIERFLKELGFRKLHRRSNKELGISRKKTIIPEIAKKLDFSILKKFRIDCPVAGVFLFLPYIIESGIIDIVEKSSLPKSGVISSSNACLSMLLLKLIGQERLSHIKNYDREISFGIFAGLNILPKATYMNSYSCRCSEEMLLEFQESVIREFSKKYPELYASGHINLDFHSIPHYGNESEMEKVWCGARGKAMKGANTVFAQDASSNALIYTRTEIKRSEEANEVKRFVNYWKNIKGEVKDTLVFDCKFTTYSVLDELTDDNIKFITLRRRYAALLKKTEKIEKSKWKKIYLPIPKRKRKAVSVYEETVRLKNCKNKFRQITIKDHGREKPTYILLNDFQRPLKDILIVYAKRWHIEQKLAELVAFFNLNALSSPLMIRIHFDILWTLIADIIYHAFAADLKRFEHCLPSTIFRKFINMPGKLIFDGQNFQVKIRKRAHTPIILGINKFKKPIPVPWLNNRTVEIIWTA